MTTVAVLVDPPRPGLVLPRLAESAPLSEEEVARIYTAMTADVVRSVESSGGELIVNYRDADALPDPHSRADAEAEVRDMITDAGAKSPRLEVQVGETFAGRAGNTATHLLETEGVQSVAIAKPTAPFLSRQHIDQAAMKLRRSDVIIGPTDGGRVHYAGFRETIDFADAYDPPALGTLTDRARDIGHTVDFLPLLPVVETGRDLATAVVLINARRRADRFVPQKTAEVIDDLGLTIDAEPDGLALRR